MPGRPPSRPGILALLWRVAPVIVLAPGLHRQLAGLVPVGSSSVQRRACADGLRRRARTQSNGGAGVAADRVRSGAGSSRALHSEEASVTDVPRALPGNDVLALIEHFDAKIDGFKKEILDLIREGRIAHTREHEAQQLVCQHSMTDHENAIRPLEAFVTEERRKDADRNARTRPLVRSAVWVTDHWPISLFVGSIIVAILYHFGVLTP